MEFNHHLRTYGPTAAAFADAREAHDRLICWQIAPRKPGRIESHVTRPMNGGCKYCIYLINHIYIYNYINICVHVMHVVICIYTYMHVCMHICIYIYICMYTHIMIHDISAYIIVYMDDR